MLIILPKWRVIYIYIYRVDRFFPSIVAAGTSGVDPPVGRISFCQYALDFLVAVAAAVAVAAVAAVAVAVAVAVSPAWNANNIVSIACIAIFCVVYAHLFFSFIGLARFIF